MSLLFGVDAFTNRPFAGNPAAVCVLEAPADPAWMQALAREMNLSETAFLWPEGDAWRLRWFTPKVEVDLCGHATLVSAHVLWRHLERAESRLAFDTRSGRLYATRAGARIGLDFPAPEAVAAPLPEAIAAALGGVRPVWSGRAEDDWIAVLESAAAVRALTPNLDLLARAVWWRRPGTKAAPTTLSRASSPRRWAWTRTPSPGRPTRAWPVTGPARWARTACAPTRPRPAAASWSSTCAATGWSCGGQR